MPTEELNFKQAVLLIFAKDGRCELRSKYAVGSLAMFALTALASVSMAAAGIALPPVVAAALLWVVLFFCAMAGLGRIFVQEQESGTLLALRMYAPGQAVFAGKLLFNAVLVLALQLLVLPLYIMFFNLNISEWGSLLLVLGLGGLGMAETATLTAAMILYARGKQAIFTVLTFPLLLPQFLSAIGSTARILSGEGADGQALIFMLGYDGAVAAAGFLLFEYLWQE